MYIKKIKCVFFRKLWQINRKIPGTSLCKENIREVIKNVIKSISEIQVYLINLSSSRHIFSHRPNCLTWLHLNYPFNTKIRQLCLQKVLELILTARPHLSTQTVQFNVQNYHVHIHCRYTSHPTPHLEEWQVKIITFEANWKFQFLLKYVHKHVFTRCSKWSWTESAKYPCRHQRTSSEELKTFVNKD